jgi:hypothetical protein
MHPFNPRGKVAMQTWLAEEMRGAPFWSVTQRYGVETHMSLRETLVAGAADLPPDLWEIVARQPPNVDRRTGATLITRHLFPVSHRSLEAWPLPTRRVNGRAIIPTLFEIAYAKLAAAPTIMGGSRNEAQQVMDS